MQKQYADVIVDISHERLDRPFQYLIPEEFEGQVRVGSRVRIPFGRGKRLIDGYVIGLSGEPKLEEEKIRPIERPAKDGSTVEGNLIRLAEWIRETYGSTMIQALKTVLPVKREKRNASAPAQFAGLQQDTEHQALTAEQRCARDAVFAEWSGKGRPCLIRGITGSGKTHVYFSLIEAVSKEGRQSIVLVPEIALTWQIVRRFYARFGDRIAVLHSGLSAAERADQFARIHAGEADVVIGPRSALFAPLPDLGLIIVDEENETSYASEKTPRYHARETAEERARMEGAHLVLGSATPSVDARFRCECGTYALIELTERFGGAKLPSVHVIDMRNELRAGNRSILSLPLQEAIADRLQRAEQTMLFLNRRGHSGFLSCRSCGYVVKCPHCDVSLTSHVGGKLICHYCGYTTGTLTKCPSCGSGYIKGFQIGTEKVEQEVSRQFPTARVLRMDADSTKKRGSYEQILRAFAEGEADILVGTQMIVKGHDFPGVTLVGAVAADLSLFAGDYRAAERTYQLLVQAVGRAGRGKRSGEAFIQTYQPEHYSIQAAAAQDYESFYEEEISARTLLGYPPTRELLAIHASGAEEETLDLAMKYMGRYVERIRRSESTALIGPAPERIAKIRDRYRRVLYIKDREPAELARIRRELERYMEINSGFAAIEIQYELNS